MHLGFELNLDFEDQTNYQLIPTKPKAKIEKMDQFVSEGAKLKFLDDESSDTHTLMWDNFMKLCFPKLWKLEEQRFNTKSETFSPQQKEQYFNEVKTAAMKELSEFFKSGEDMRDLRNTIKRKDRNEDN